MNSPFTGHPIKHGVVLQHPRWFAYFPAKNASTLLAEEATSAGVCTSASGDPELVEIYILRGEVWAKTKVGRRNSKAVKVFMVCCYGTRYVKRYDSVKQVECSKLEKVLATS